MCEANAYLLKDGIESLVMADVDKLVPDGPFVMLESIFGEKKFIKAAVKELALVDHKIILEGRM